MIHHSLATYLNDHLAGSVTAIELLKDLEISSDSESLETFAGKLAAQIEDDQRQLRSIIDQLPVNESLLRKSAAWFAEKGAQLKLRADDPGHGKFHAFEVLEILSLGIEGKRTLWKTLRHLQSNMPALEIIDFDLLLQRADDQRAQVEDRRLQIAREALIG